jgi:hypothetical protein
MDGYTTIERARAHLEALKVEQTGYDARIRKIKAGGLDPLDEKALAERVKGVKAEIGRLSKELGKTTDGDVVEVEIPDEVEAGS